MVHAHHENATYAFDDRLGNLSAGADGLFPIRKQGLTLNAPYPSQTTDSQPESPQAALSLQGQQVLLVEDCPDQGRLYLNFLQCAGADVTLECTGQSAVDTVKKSIKQFDSIVMDFQMPELDGLDATRQLREMGYQGTIIGVTAFNSEELKKTWFHAGCNDILEKPLVRSTLISAVL